MMTPSSSSFRRAPRCAPLVCALGLLAIAGGGRAQTNGIKFGAGRVHPFFQLESRYDSAIMSVWQNSPTGAIKGDMVLHLRPGLNLEMPSDVLAVGMRGQFDYVMYTGWVTPGADNLSYLGGDADLGLKFNRAGQVSVEVGDRAARSDRAITPSLSVGVLSFTNDAHLQVNIHPSGGALQVEPNYHLVTETYRALIEGEAGPGCVSGDPVCDPKAVPTLDNVNHTFGLATRWKFLPKTAIGLDASFGMRTYSRGSNEGEINFLKAGLGLTGLLTPRVTTVLRLGWAQDFTRYTFESLVGQAELGYLLSPAGQIKAGFVRSFEPVGGGYVSYRDDRGYLDARMPLGGRIATHGRIEADLLTYQDGEKRRKDARATADLGLSYQLRQWVTAGAGYTFTFLYTPHAPQAPTSALKRSEVYAHLKATY